MIALSGILHIEAPGAVDGIVQRRNRIVLGIGVIGICIVLWTRPDISNYVEASRFVRENTTSWFLRWVDDAAATARSWFT